MDNELCWEGFLTGATDAFGTHDNIADGFRSVLKVYGHAVFLFLDGDGPLSVLDGHVGGQPLPQAGPVGPDELAGPVVAAAHLDGAPGPIHGDLGHEGQRAQVVYLLERRHVGRHGRVEVVQHPGGVRQVSPEAHTSGEGGKTWISDRGRDAALRVQSNRPPLESFVGVIVALEDLV